MEQYVISFDEIKELLVEQKYHEEDIGWDYDDSPVGIVTVGCKLDNQGNPVGGTVGGVRETP